MSYRAADATVSPEFALDERDILGLVREFGILHGRYLACDPESWETDFFRHVDALALSETARARLFSNVKDIKRLLLADSMFAGNDWSRVSCAHDLRKSYAIAVGSALDPGQYMTWSDAEQALGRSRRSTVRHDGSIEDYLELLRPFVFHWPTIFWIDPYLDPLSEFGQIFFDEILGRVRSRKTCRCAEINLVVKGESLLREGKIDEARYFEEFKEFFTEHRRGVVSVRLFGIHGGKRHQPAEPGGFPYLHDRFLLCAGGGVSMTHSMPLWISRHLESFSVSPLSDKRFDECKADWMDVVANKVVREVENIRGAQFVLRAGSRAGNLPEFGFGRID